MSEQSSEKKKISGRDLGFLLGGAAVVLVVGALLILRSDSDSAADGAGKPGTLATTVDGGGETGAEPVALRISEKPVDLALQIDVLDPPALLAALRSNAWLKKIADAPLHAGFVGSWRGFLGTRGEDLGGGFKGTLLELLVDELLDAPFQALWFRGQAATRTPALVLHDPGRAAKKVFEILQGAVQNGSYSAERCPGDPVDDEQEAAANDAPRPPRVLVSRWLVADRALYAAHSDDRLVLASRPLAVVHGVCAELSKPVPRDDVDLQIVAQPGRFGRGPQLLNALLGLQQVPGFEMVVKDGRLVPRGIRSASLQPGALVAAPVDDDLLKLVPEDMEVLLVLQLALPAELDPASLRAALAGSYQGPRAPRQVALLWTPHGTRGQPTEVALLWSRLDDGPALERLFSGPNTLVRRELCQHLVLASTETLLERIDAACLGRKPNLLHAAPAVVAGLKQRKSIGLSLQLGRLLWRLTEDAYRAELASQGSGKEPLPEEMQQTRSLLEELPLLGFDGVVEGQTLAPGGYRS